MLFGAAVALAFTSCTGGGSQQPAETDSTAVETEVEAEPEPEPEPEYVKGPTTLEEESFSIDVPEGWQVTKHSSSSCTIEPVETPEEGSNFGWGVRMTIWDGSVFKAEDKIKTEQDVFEGSKSQPNQKLGDYTYLYTYYDYEFGDHSVLSAPLTAEGGCIDFEIGGWKLEDTPAIQEIIKSLKVKL